MIQRNIGTPERVIRFLLSLVLVGWVIAADRFGVAQAAALAAAFALLWNSIFARCYLWKWLRISSCDPARDDCSSGGSGAQGA
jgi:hypothetical protein